MKHLFLIIFSILLSGSVQANESPQSILGSKNTLDRHERIELARSLSKALEKFARSFPSVTPDERDYIRQETDVAQSDRLERLINSEEYLIYEVQIDIDELRRHLSKLQKSNLTRTIEVKHWAATSYHLINSINSNYGRLRDMNVIRRNLTFPAWTDYFGRQILLKTIIEP